MDLIRHSQTGDEDAFANLFQKYKNLVYKTAYLMLNNVDDAEDVLQEVFIQVHKALSTYQSSKGAFTTWLYRITVNHCLNRRRKRHLFVLSYEEVSPELLTDRRSPFDIQLAEEEATWQALSQLSEKLRTVVILRYYWELPYAEIAQILDVPMGTVKSRLNLAIRSLHEKLGTTAENDSASKSFHLMRVAK